MGGEVAVVVSFLMAEVSRGIVLVGGDCMSGVAVAVEMEAVVMAEEKVASLF